eukprot:m.173448 g.173448  ORF g.173448 m.173448 type:complete len:201 (-) comp16530_c3_seq3:2479-3081(-)
MSLLLSLPLSLLLSTGRFHSPCLLSSGLLDFFASFPRQPPFRPSELDMVLSHKDDETDKIALFWVDDSKIGIGKMREYLDKLIHQHIKSALLIVQDKLTPSAMKAIRELNAAGHLVQVFDMTELIVNITKHELVPKHIVLSREEKKALLERYKLKEQQLPRMKTSDPVAKYFGLKRGQVCKILRENSPTAGRYVSYRIVF